MEGVAAEGPKSTQLTGPPAGKRGAQGRPAMMQRVVCYVFNSVLRRYCLGWRHYLPINTIAHRNRAFTKLYMSSRRRNGAYTRGLQTSTQPEAEPDSEVTANRLYSFTSS
jgi:hypothetical protein